MSDLGAANRRHILKGIAALGAATAVPSPLIAAPRFDRARRVLTGLVEAGLPCAMGGIDTKKGRPEFISAGNIDIGSTRTPDAHSLWRLASMTKPIVGRLHG